MAAGSDYLYGWDPDKVNALNQGVTQLWEGVESYINSKVGNVKDAVGAVWEGEDQKAFSESFEKDIKALYQEILKLRDEVEENIKKVQTAWEETQAENKTAMSSLGRYSN